MSNLTRDLEKGRSGVKRSMTLYHQKTEAAENALISYEKAQQDPTFTHKNLAKLNSSATKLRKDAENADNSYQSQLQEFQQFQVKYEENMKEILRVIKYSIIYLISSTKFILHLFRFFFFFFSFLGFSSN